MSRTERLMDLLESLRRRKYAVSARVLAVELETSLRTVYRDIATLQAQGVPVEGEAGVGYLLRSGYTVPPLMFTPEELEALVLGARWVVDRADGRLGLAARNGLAKIRAVVPPALQDELDSSALLIPSQPRLSVDEALVEALRTAIRLNRKMDITYRDLAEKLTRRIVWPFALAFYDQVLVFAAWCETRADFRHFRVDRVETWSLTEEPCPRRRSDLLREWREKRGIPSDRLDL
jgi:predicted DNA-binding transcriptional regulator YafY